MCQLVDETVWSGDVLVALGANLPDRHGRAPLATLRAAVEQLRALPGLRLVRSSAWYETEPIPPGGPRYLNGMVWLQGQATPAGLLAALQAIEARAGRVRTLPNAPRVLDLDIIAMGQMIRATPDPILPHQRAHLRHFVLAPLCELRPDWVHPVLQQTAAQLQAALAPQGVALL